MTRLTTTDSGAAGKSARKEYDRRRDARRARLRARYGIAGSIVAGLAGEPLHLSAWQRGSEGEAATAGELEARLRRTDTVLLHDRRLPGHGRANIDHLAIGPGGLTVIDTKSSRGAVRLTTVGFVHRRDLLLVGHWDRTSDLDAVERQVDAITGRLSRTGVDVSDIIGALCFPFMRRRWLHRSQARDGRVLVEDPRHIAKLARRPGPLTRDDIEALAEAVSEAFPPAIR